MPYFEPLINQDETISTLSPLGLLSVSLTSCIASGVAFVLRMTFSLFHIFPECCYLLLHFLWLCCHVVSDHLYLWMNFLFPYVELWQYIWSYFICLGDSFFLLNDFINNGFICYYFSCSCPPFLGVCVRVPHRFLFIYHSSWNKFLSGSPIWYMPM